jgi:hypothetical protein
MNLTDEQVKTLDIELVMLSLTTSRAKATRIVEKMYEFMNPRLLSKKDFINLAVAAKVVIENE